MRTTINKINKALAVENIPIEIVKGESYFYFAAIEGAPMGIENNIASIFSYQLGAMSVDEYVEHVKACLEGYNLS